MTPENFAYWLQGFVELHGVLPSAEQWEQIKAHLNLVFERKTAMLSNPLRVGELKNLQQASDKYQAPPRRP